jgi:nicotinamidase-related amidase
LTHVCDISTTSLHIDHHLISTKIVRLTELPVCSPGGYLEQQGYSLAPTRAIIPQISSLLSAFRRNNYPIYHTREGHRPDLSTLSARELQRSRNNATGFGIGDAGPLGRLLIRGEPGHEIIPELTPLEDEPVIDKPGRGAFAHTDFELLLRLRGVKNLVICGVTTDVCVSSTMREANDRGFDCLLVSNATAAAEEGLWRKTIDGVMEEGGIFGAVGEAEDVLRMFVRSETESEHEAPNMSSKGSYMFQENHEATGQSRSIATTANEAVDEDMVVQKTVHPNDM